MTEVNTPSESVSSPPGDGGRARRRPPGGWAWVGAVVLVVLGLVAVSTVVPVSFLGEVTPGTDLQIDQELVAQKPGSARPVADRVEVGLSEVDHPDGRVLLTTVALDTQVSVWDWVRGQIDDDIELRPRAEVLGTRSVAENRERNLEMMRTSKDAAVINALEYLGIPVVENLGVAFETVLDDGPAHGVLEPGDTIIAIDGTPIHTLQELVDDLATKVPGETGRLTVENFDTLAIRDETIVWGVNPDHEGGFIGIQNVFTHQEDLPLPFEVDIDSGSIGGPSAGLAFTLTIIDLLTEGELTGGNRVAVTGTINAGGVVGNIGGAGQKAAAAHDAGAVAFLVPVDSAELARDHAGGMEIIGVATLQDAIDALGRLGGDVEDLRLVPSAAAAAADAS